MDYIQITKDNIEKEHICCAMSGKQSVMKKEWLKQRFAEGLVFYRSTERGKCGIEYIPAENARQNNSCRIPKAPPAETAPYRRYPRWDGMDCSKKPYPHSHPEPHNAAPSPSGTDKNARCQNGS